MDFHDGIGMGKGIVFKGKGFAEDACYDDSCSEEACYDMAAMEYNEDLANLAEEQCHYDETPAQDQFDPSHDDNLFAFTFSFAGTGAIDAQSGSLGDDSDIQSNLDEDLATIEYNLQKGGELAADLFAYHLTHDTTGGIDIEGQYIRNIIVHQALQNWYAQNVVSDDSGDE